MCAFPPILPTEIVCDYIATLIHVIVKILYHTSFINSKKVKIEYTYQIFKKYNEACKTDQNNDKSIDRNCMFISKCVSAH